MPRLKPSDKIEALRRQQIELTAKMKEAEAKARDRKREDEQRREMLVGRCVLAQLGHETDSEWGKITLKILSQTLTKPSDRGLFPELVAGDTTTLTPENSHKAKGDATGAS